MGEGIISDLNGSRYREDVVPFQTEDGFRCNLVRVRHAEREPEKGPVLLAHGAGVRANLFRPPVRTSIVDALVAAGYDVWLENWRGSIDLPPNPWTLDQAALYDHPAAVETVCRETGSREVKAVVHCQGSGGFLFSAVAGLLPQVTHIVANGVSLHTEVPWWSRVKLRAFLPLAARSTSYLNTQWRSDAPSPGARMLAMTTRLGHHECRNWVCKAVSTTYGAGFPALWTHDHVSTATHAWVANEFAHCPVSFFRQMAASVRAGHTVRVGDADGRPLRRADGRTLPTSVVAEEPRTRANITLTTGSRNRCFLPSSQRRSHAYLREHGPSDYALHEVEGYGHLDVFWSPQAPKRTFPLILNALES